MITFWKFLFSVFNLRCDPNQTDKNTWAGFFLWLQLRVKVSFNKRSNKIGHINLSILNVGSPCTVCPCILFSENHRRKSETCEIYSTITFRDSLKSTVPWFDLTLLYISAIAPGFLQDFLPPCSSLFQVKLKMFEFIIFCRMSVKNKINIPSDHDFLRCHSISRF